MARSTSQWGIWVGHPCLCHCPHRAGNIWEDQEHTPTSPRGQPGNLGFYGRVFELGIKGGWEKGHLEVKLTRAPPPPSFPELYFSHNKTGAIITNY